MSTVLTGTATNVTTPLIATVAGTASGTGGVIVIQTTTAHFFGPADTVIVSSVGGTTEANGTWVITVIDATHYSLNGSTWVNAWTSGGTCNDTSLTPQIQVPSDGDPLSAQLSGLLSSQQATLDRTQFLQNEIILQNGGGLITTEYTTGTTITVPPRAVLAFVQMCGGGGGGAAGATLGGNQPNAACPAGGGGAGAQLVTQVLPVAPGDSITITIGAGGSGGTADGSTGGTSEVLDTTSGLFVKAPGGSGGTYGALMVALNSNPYGSQGGLDLYSLGGEGCGGNPLNPFGDGGSGVQVPVVTGLALDVLGYVHLPSTPGSGGSGYASAYYQTASPTSVFPTGYAGRESLQGFAGGSPGTAVSVSSGGSNYYSGGSGGGGGGGPFGVGAAGGNPGTGNSSGTGGNATAGSAAAANTGAGGGGGGGAGCGSTTSGNKGAGGAGGSGRVRITWYTVPNLTL